ncbi:AraC family transcriptional regulator [Sphingobacterium sp. CZ-UAM]|uniref:AraC family transcriptional regulator n=1 Tax=unclassified Sphingobacterium TaxID=2609468 RepID=UPI000987953B|nr:AraC family transcriptional regulator [Sphingobacterium sp. CZ-UAM]OOG17603.1 AraC family transcriptional regulator [Sphingobacterium sp. CZ-UAM]
MIPNTDVIAEGFKGEKAIVLPYSVCNYQAQSNITSKLHITHIGYYPTAKKHYRDRQEGCTEYILIYCEKGRGWIKQDEMLYNLSRNDLYIIPKNTTHSYGSKANDPWSIYWIHFQGTEASLFENIIGQIIHINDTDSNKHTDRFQLFESIYKNLEMGYSPENLEYTSFCLQYFLASIKYAAQYEESNRIKHDNIIQDIIMFMKDNLESNISLDEISAHFNYSKSHMISLFKQKTSYPPMVYYNQLRMQRACSYLQFTLLKIKEIAFKLNFYDPFHFSKAFTKEMKMSPQDYRKKYQK